jgi:mono/diheme cytochrome c family protein
MLRSFGGFLLAMGLSACGEDKSDEASSSGTGGSSGIVASADGKVLVAALAEDGVVVRVDLARGWTRALAIGGEPTRVARQGDRYLVTLRTERAIAVLEDRGDGLVEVDRVETGTEPAAIAVTPDGGRVYVVLSTQEEVHELDAELNFLRALPVRGQPEWIAVHPSGKAVYVGTVVRGAFWIDVSARDPAALPLDIPDVIGSGLEGTDPMTERVTGDPAVDPEGRRLAVPAVWQDVMRPPRHTDEQSQQRDPAERYREIGLGISPNNPGVVIYALDEDGRPQPEAQALYAVGNARPEGEAPRVVRSYLAGVSWAPAGDVIYGAMEGSRVVVALDPARAALAEALAGFHAAPAAFVGTGNLGVNGVLPLESGEVFAFHTLARLVRALPDEDLRAELAAQADGAEPTPLVPSGPFVPLGESTLDPQVEAGRQLFFDATSGVMSTAASGVSCATCHMVGRTSGINVMERDLIARQVPTFAGPIAMTAPFTWNNLVPTVPEEARITSQIRLGGRDVTEDQLEAVAAYIEQIRDVDTPEKGSTAPEVARGRALFERPDVGCSGCHNGVRLTDNLDYDLYGLTGVNTPTLVGIVATAPYLHDGRADTLRDVLETTRRGEMGNTSLLTEAELDDLEAYLRSL